MSAEYIVITGAREHNLKNVTVKIPKNKLVVVTGVSGSGKSSLAFDTLYAEGQRRYVESLSSYARQFLGQMEKPKYDSIKGLSPTIAIEQKSASNNPRSTVGTVTEVYDYLRVLYARLGVQFCHVCGNKVGSQTAERIVTQVLALPTGTKLSVLAPIVTARKGEYRVLLEAAQARGYSRARIDGRIVELDGEWPTLDKKTKHTIDLVIDRIVVATEAKDRVTDSVEAALREGKGTLILALPEGDRVLSENRTCTKCGISFPELTPQAFSFNSPLGACAECNGLGSRPEMDEDLLVPDSAKTIAGGAIAPWAAAMTRAEGWKAETVLYTLQSLGVALDVPWSQLSKAKREAVLTGMVKGKKVWEGLGDQLMRRFLATDSDEMKAYYMRYLSDKPCRSCKGQRLRAESRAVRIGEMGLADFGELNVRSAVAFIDAIPLSAQDREIASELLKEIRARLGFLLDVGLDYLTLARGSGTLSGGESQRIRLASQIGSELTGVIYVLDEPSIGLHQRDNERLVNTLARLRDLGNSVIVVEHDEDTMRAADWVIDCGPGAGVLGGQVMAEGTVATLERSKRSLTGAYLSGARSIATPKTRRPGNGTHVAVLGATEHNLRNVDVQIPLGTFTVVTGVSGAGKSTLINRILLPALARRLHDAREPIGAHTSITGLELLDKVIAIDQKPIGRTPRSNPVTYTKIFDSIRAVFAQTKEARAFGYDAGRFSFNVKGGRCEACGGDGLRRVEMHFLPDVYVTCDECEGRRFNEATLRVRFKDKNIHEVLSMSVDEALLVFEHHRDIKRGLQTLADVGLGYMKLGQSSPTLSGGEAQRIKLARELSKIGSGRTLYVLDEPTTGLHFADVERLLGVLARLVEAGNTVLVIEHNLDVVRSADWVIDLGPEGGDAGGLVIATGTPEQVAKERASYTGKWLKAAFVQEKSRAKNRQSVRSRG